MERLIPGISASVRPIAFMFFLRISSSFSSYSGCKSLAMMTGSFSFGVKNAYFRFSSSDFSSKVGGSIMDGANLSTTSAGFTSAPTVCEKFYTTASSYPMEIKSAEVFAEIIE